MGSQGKKSSYVMNNLVLLRVVGNFFCLLRIIPFPYIYSPGTIFCYNATFQVPEHAHAYLGPLHLLDFMQVNS